MQNLAPAKACIDRLRRRDLFAFIDEILLTPESLKKYKASHIKQEIYDYLVCCNQKSNVELNDIFVSVINMGYGKGGKNPVCITGFYEPIKAFHDIMPLLDDCSECKSVGISFESISNSISNAGNTSEQRYKIGFVPQGLMLSTFLL